MTTPAQYEAAMRALIMALADEHTQHPTGLKAALAIVREAREVRETVAARMDGWLAHYPEDVFPPTPVTDAQSAQVLRLMLPRIKADLLESLTPEVPDAR